MCFAGIYVCANECAWDLQKSEEDIRSCNWNYSGHVWVLLTTESFLTPGILSYPPKATLIKEPLYPEHTSCPGSCYQDISSTKQYGAV